jgi:hypothetical protein
MNFTAFQIAVIRAKMIAHREFGRAVQLLIAAGVALNDAARFLLAVLRMRRAAA